MAKKKKKQEKVYDKVSLAASIKGTFRDLFQVFGFLTNKEARRVHDNTVKGAVKDVRSGWAYICARPIRTGLALVATMGLVVLASLFFFDKDKRIKQQLEQAEASLVTENFDNAVTHFESAFKLGVVDEPSVYLNYISALIGKGDEKKTREVISRLAPGPGNSPGIEAVHRFLALDLSKRLTESGLASLNDFKWHLDHSGEVDSTELNVAWAQYYLAMGQPDKAVSFFRKAAADDPKLYDQVIACYGAIGQDALQNSAARDARPKIESLLEQHPKDESVRVILARILNHLGDDEACEQLLVEGLELTDSRLIRSACADFYLRQYRLNMGTSSFSDNLQLLKKTYLLSPDVNGIPTEFQRLYRVAKSSEEKAAVLDVLREACEQPEAAFRAHTLLSSLLWGENKKLEALEHAEQAYELDPTHPVSVNNLAYQLSELDVPDLDRALQLSRMAVDRVPQNANARDTLGNILMKLNQYQAATNELEKALALNIPDSESVHEKLANCYEQLGYKEMAQQHAAQSNRASKTTNPQKN